MHHFFCWIVLACLLLPCPDLAAQSGKGQAERDLQRLGEQLLDRLAIKARSAPPRWAQRKTAPRFTFAVVSDIHLRRDSQVLERAMRAINRLAPAFVVITGDNVSGPTIAQHRRLKKLLDEGLRCPYHIVKGDNDARNYSRVFGATHWSFLYGGLHFLGSALDVDAEAVGIGYMEPGTLRWLSGRLRAHRTRPTLYFQHENIVPPTFLHAPRLALLLLTRPQVAGTLTGHLHHDLGLQLGRKYHLIVPGLKMGPRHPFKLCRVYHDGVVVQTVERKGNAYELVQKWQRFRFGKRFQLAPGQKNRLTEFAARKPQETRFDPDLTRRWDALRRSLNRWGKRAEALLPD